MVVTGFSRIHVAKYIGLAPDMTRISYRDVRELARAKGMTINVNTSNENTFYANNEAVETEPAKFKDGTVIVHVDGLSGEEEAFILGIETDTIMVGDKEVPIVNFGRKMNPPYMGIAGVKRYQLNGVVSYRPVILLKGKFAIPPDSGETQEENINWQTQQLTATLVRDDSPNKNWKMIPVENFETEEEAVNFIKAVLSEWEVETGDAGEEETTTDGGTTE